MYILLFLIVLLLVLALGAHSFFGWAMAETPEDGGAAAQARQRERSFHDPRTWAAFRRWLNQKPPLLWSRRDRRGRFRKMR